MLPIFTTAICVLTALVTYRAFRDPALQERLLFDPRAVLAEKQWYRLLSSALIHRDWAHCGFNLLSLYLFGEPLELVMGGWILLAIYLAAILGGKFLALYVHRHHDYRSLGASGGVCGVIFASIFLVPGTEINLLFIPIGIPGWAYALFFLAGTFIAAKKGNDNVGHESHFGGATTGMVAALLIEPDACLGHPFQFFGALTLALVCLGVFLRDPLGLRPIAYENRQPAVRDQRNDEARQRLDQKAELDRLLDKISAAGVEKMSAKERRRLEELSKALAKGRQGGA